MSIAIHHKDGCFMVTDGSDPNCLKQILYNSLTDVCVEQVIKPQQDDPAFVFLREIITFIKKTQQPGVTELVVRRWEGPILMDEGTIRLQNPLGVITKKGTWQYDSTADLLKDGWR